MIEESARSGSDDFPPLKRLWAPWRMEFIRAPEDDECIFCAKPREEERLRENLILARGEESFVIPKGLTTCPCSERRSIWSTDALRIHERFHDMGTNGEAFGEVMQVWERVLLIHLLRAFERRGLLAHAHRIAFFVDGPLALFGHPAWLSAAISAELQRINAKVRKLTGRDLVIVGVEKSGTFVTHFDEVDQTEEPGKERFDPRNYFLPTDDYIKQHVIYSDSPKRYGKDTYFGRKFFYKTRSGARIVASIPFLETSQDTLDSDDVGLYPSFGRLHWCGEDRHLRHPLR